MAQGNPKKSSNKFVAASKGKAKASKGLGPRKGNFLSIIVESVSKILADT